ncbi:MAG: aminodeoxychorismate lyase [Alcanivorax sp.]|nr:aminodeoxychorismate lyase [Alcanivorax sp.]
MRIDSRDRGLAYGDGVFETLRVGAAGTVPLWSHHRRRLLAGCQALGIPLETAHLERQLADQLSAGSGQGGVLKLLVSRGPGGRGYLPPADPRPTLLWQRAALPVWPLQQRQHGVVLGLCQQPLFPEPLAGLKHLNRLPQVQARREVARQGWDEGLLLSPRRQPLEATAMNLFARFDDHWWTPDLLAARAGVQGVMRAWLLEQLGETVRCELRPLSHLRRARSLFLCNSVVGVLPVRKLAQWTWPVVEPVEQLQQTVESLF